METASQDGKVGKDIQLASFSLNSAFKLYSQDEIYEYIYQADRNRENLKKAFYSE